MIPWAREHRSRLSLWFGLIICTLVIAPLPRQARAADCTAAQRTAADRQLWLNTKDKNRSISRHLPWGLPRGPAEAANESLLVQRDYVINYDADLKVPVWVAYRLDFARLGKSKRIDCFRQDPRIATSAAAKLNDYKERIFDQGHLANNADMTGSRNSVINSFILSNMAPQYCQFNEGVWQMLENIVRLWAKDKGAIYVVTGSIFDRDGDAKRDADRDAKLMKAGNGKERVAIPTAFFKVIVLPRDDNILETVTLILPNDQTDLDREAAVNYIREHVSKIANVEAVTGLKLLPAFTGTVEEAAVMWTFTGSPGHSLVGDRCRATAGLIQ